MNAKQKSKVIKAIKKDCKLRFAYYKDGETCAVGCLALLAGVSPATLERLDNMDIDQHSATYVARKINSKFGLSLIDLKAIQTENDEFDLRRDRVRAVLKYVKSISHHLTK